VTTPAAVRPVGAWTGGRTRLPTSGRWHRRGRRLIVELI
jgi:hypothetical protein